MRIAITGSKGQLGTALQGALCADTLLLMDLPEHDITNLAATVATLTAFAPEVIIHTAAMVNVDGCEKDPEMATRVNVLGTRNIAVVAQRAGAAMVYISTDYVFDGTKGAPYWEHDDPNPLSVYARTKRAGEQVVQSLSLRYWIVRTAWMYGNGPRNFPETVLRLAQERGAIQMVTDEVGSPTYAVDLAAALAQLIRQPAYGIYHLPNAGVCSRYEWAAEVLRLASVSGVTLTPSENYARAARVPKQVEMRNFNAAELGIAMRPWREALAAYFAARGHE
jgi:dTDP-4-dehydrorhamnose reductase